MKTMVNQMKKVIFLVVILVASVSSGAVPADIKARLKLQPPGRLWLEHVDFAKLQGDRSIRFSDLMSLTPEDLVKWNQEELDQLYSRLTAGYIPNGPFKGYIQIPKDIGMGQIMDIMTAASKSGIIKLAAGKENFIAGFGEVLWKGKVFYKKEGLLRNRISRTGAEFLSSATNLGRQGNMFSKMWGRLKDYFTKGMETELFPAQLFCGQSLLDSRRESIIIDYTYTESLPGAVPLDRLVGKNGTNIRDEIRMVRPGFYMGRAYANRYFLVNFFLYKEDIAAEYAKQVASSGGVYPQPPQECWNGTQEANISYAKK